MHELYLYRHSGNSSSTEFILNPGYFLQVFKPVFFSLKRHKGNILIHIIWFVFTLGKYFIVYIMDENKNIIHHSYALPKFFKFPFMQKDDIQIGPCWTHKDYRGKGIYPFVLE